MLDFRTLEPNKISLHQQRQDHFNRINKTLPSRRIMKCRERYKIRKKFRKSIETTKLLDSDDGRPFTKIKIFNDELICLLDSGANISALGKSSLDFVNRNNVQLRKIKSSVLTANGSRTEVIGYCSLPVTYMGVTKSIVFYIIPNLSLEAYLGVNFWRAYELAPQIISSIELDFKPETDFHDLSLEQKYQLRKVISEFPSFEKLGLGCTNLVEHHIDTGDATPVKSKHYPLSPPRQAEIYEELDRLLALGVIEETNSPWCSPIVTVRKPGKIRLCLDCRKINSLTKKDSYPLPHINGLLSRLKDTHFISGIDLKDAFFQIRLSETSKEKTAFAVPGRPLYQYRVMPFGVCNGPQTMSRLMDKAIPSRLRDNVFVYLDDLLICTQNFEEHTQLLSEVARCLKLAGLTINVGKSKFCQREIKYLGYIIGGGNLKVDPGKVEAIVTFPLPKTPRQVRRFIGMCNWYRAFINNFSDLAGPLTDSLKKGNKPFRLTQDAIDSFDKLKSALSSAPVLAQPDFTKEFVIQCDASRIGVGGVLYQLDEEGKERPIAFVSQKLNRAQRNYTVTELECLAAVVCVKRFRQYIDGLPFKIITDHSSLRWLMGQKDLNGRLARWSLKLQCFDFVMEHRKGSLNVVPDTLSRFDIDQLNIDCSPPEIDFNSVEFDSKQYNDLRQTILSNGDKLPDLCLSDNFVYKRVRFRDNEEEQNLWRLWVPETLTHSIIKSAHEAGCHGGYAKTIFRIRQKYYWPQMARDVKLYIQECDDCKIIKPANITLRPPMGNQFITVRPFQRLYCDFLGPYPCSKLKNCNLFITLDHLTKFVFLKPVKSATTNSVIDFFQNDIFCTFGVPQYIHSDNAKQFTSKEMKEFFDVYGIKHITTGFYSPQANNSERVNREIVSKIRHYLKHESDHTNWDSNISKILTILRSDFHSSIQCSPYFALFGQNMISHGSSFAMLEKLGMLSDDIGVFHSDRLQHIRDRIRENLNVAHEKASRTYNTRARPVHFVEGQEVFRKNHSQSDFKKGINAKFCPKFIKCRIRKKVGNSLYDIEDLQGKYIGKYHASDIRP